MNTQRAVIWAGFLGVSAALAWVPDLWFGQDDGVAAFAGKPAPTEAQDKPSGKFRAKKTTDFVWGGGSSGFKFRTARAGSRYLPTLNTT